MHNALRIIATANSNINRPMNTIKIEANTITDMFLPTDSPGTIYSTQSIFAILIKIRKSHIDKQTIVYLWR